MGCDDDTRIAELRSDIIPRKDAAVQQILSQWQQQEQQQDNSQNLLELLTYMQQELAALQQELSGLEARKLQEQQQDEAGQFFEVCTCQQACASAPRTCSILAAEFDVLNNVATVNVSFGSCSAAESPLSAVQHGPA